MEIICGAERIQMQSVESSPLVFEDTKSPYLFSREHNSRFTVRESLQEFDDTPIDDDAEDWDARAKIRKEADEKSKRDRITSDPDVLAVPLRYQAIQLCARPKQTSFTLMDILCGCNALAPRYYGLSFDKAFQVVGINNIGEPLLLVFFTPKDSPGPGHVFYDWLLF
jgi:hypothetical protein